MSVASTSRTIKFISKAGTYTAVIMSPYGDLYQEYESQQGEDTVVDMDFSEVRPTINFVCTSSRVAEGVIRPVAMEVYFNNRKIDFDEDDANNSTGDFKGYFRLIEPKINDFGNYYGLHILKNIVALSAYETAVIKMVATINYGTLSDKIQATYTIPVKPATGNSYRATIAAGDNKNFVITEKGGSCILKAMLYQSGRAITDGLTYKWQKMDGDGWKILTGKEAQTLTVNGDDINTYGEYRVMVYRQGVEVGTDIQSVMDASDPYDIDPHPIPEDETITEDTAGNGQVTYTPVVVKRGTAAKALETKFYFVLKDAAGVYLNTDRETPKASQTVTRAHCIQAGGDVSVTITSEE